MNTTGEGWTEIIPELHRFRLATLSPSAAPSAAPSASARGYAPPPPPPVSHGPPLCLEKDGPASSAIQRCHSRVQNVVDVDVERRNIRVPAILGLQRDLLHHPVNQLPQPARHRVLV